MSGDPAGWVPVRLDRANGTPTVEWCYTAGYDFDDPFFDQTIQRCLREPARLLFRRRTRLTELADAGAPAPTGLIAHMSRCGSTLVSQMLAARDDMRCWSEPPVVDAVVRAAAAGECGTAAVRGVLGAFAARGMPQSAVKLDAWTALDLGVVRAALPGTPLVMLVRDPLEVLVSQAGHRGYHMIPGTLPAHVLGLRPDQLPHVDLDEYGAIVLGRILEAAHTALHRDPNALVVDYRQLPDAVTGIAAWFGLETGPRQAELMGAAARRDAKNPVVQFAADGARKREAATGTMRVAVDRWARPWYERLLRLATRSP